MSTTHVQFTDLGRTLLACGERGQRALSAGMLSAARRIQGALVRRAQTIKSDRGFPGFNTGEYARAWKTFMMVGAEGPYILIQNDRPYAGVLEYGRRAGRMPPPSALAPWVKRKLRVANDSQANGIAFVIARKLKSRNVAGRAVLTEPAFQEQMKKWLKGEVMRELNNALRGV